MTQQPPPNQQGGYYHSQYSQQPSQQPSYPQQQQPYEQQPYEQQPAYPQQSPQYPQQYPQQGVPAEPQAPYSPQPYGSQPYSPQPYPPQPQPGYGGQPPYGDQPGYYPGAGTPQPPQKSSKKLWAILGSIGGVILLVVGGIVVRSLIGEAAQEVQLNFEVPKVGECITQESTQPNSDTEVVDCTSAEAAWEVVGNDGTWVEADFWSTPAEEMCTAYEGTEQMLWIGEITGDQTGEGEVVCLASVAAG